MAPQLRSAQGSAVSDEDEDDDDDHDDEEEEDSSDWLEMGLKHLAQSGRCGGWSTILSSQRSAGRKANDTLFSTVIVHPGC